MINQDSQTPRSPIAVEPLESRVCLAALLGADGAHHLGQVAIHPAAQQQQQQQKAAAPRTTMIAPHAKGARHVNGNRLAGNFVTAAAAATAPVVHQTVIELPGIRLVITVRGRLHPPGLDWAPPDDGYGDVAPATPPGTSSGGGGTKVTNPRVALAAPATTRGSAELVQAPADSTGGGGEAASADNVSVLEDAVATGPMLATATTTLPAMQTLASSASAVIDRLSSTWHDGSAAAAVDFAADALVTKWLPVATQTFVAAAADAASNLLAPLAGGADGIARAAAAAMAPVANTAAYEIAHMGSPFALLADSLATFVEESATVTNVVARANARGPWALTAGVIAADVIVLTYVYRRKSTRRRAQLAPVGVA